MNVKPYPTLEEFQDALYETWGHFDLIDPLLHEGVSPDIREEFVNQIEELLIWEKDFPEWEEEYIMSYNEQVQESMWYILETLLFESLTANNLEDSKRYLEKLRIAAGEKNNYYILWESLIAILEWKWWEIPEDILRYLVEDSETDSVKLMMFLSQIVSESKKWMKLLEKISNP